MNNQVTTNSIRELDVEEIAAVLGPVMADFSSFIRNPKARENALKLFKTARKAGRDFLESDEGAEAWERMDWNDPRPPLPSRFQLLEDLETPEKAMISLRNIVKSAPHRMFVEKCMEFVREAEACSTLKEFAVFMARSAGNNKVKSGYRGQDEVIVYVAREEIRYGPNTPVTETAWPYVAAVWGILREERELFYADLKNRANDLAKETTPGLALSDVVDNYGEGKIVLDLDRGRVALLSFFKHSGDSIEAEILGTNYSRLQWRPIRILLPNFEPDKGFWPTDSFGFQKALREQLQVERRNQELQKRLGPLRTQKLLPEDLAQQSMTKLLLGEGEGDALAYHLAFSQNGAGSGFFGITLTRRENEFVLAAVESDLPFPQSLVGEEIPLRVQDKGAGNVPFINMYLGDAEEEHKEALDMIRRLLVLRTRLENSRR
ncbi:MAG: hypothetical protein Q7K38_01685 [Candidatus Wildermuthbacteria bacterium]|nr:hypothetical protein [Candidatus Wildermuthbacteria bacterium]